ncbi:hypothetical protein BC829DRAFT_427182 [Chytridium lagenaria]|nr:hypothetical protein BC829DRAFT_427182 [Chytridium lagenaria]
MDNSSDVFPDPELQESLISENDPDPMEGEQTWPTEEELADADKRVAAVNGKGKRTVRAPKGTSSYQAAWIVEDDEFEGSEEGSNSEGDEEMGDAEGGENIEEDEDDDQEYEDVELEGGKEDFDTDFNLADDERQYEEYLEEKKSRAAEDLEFPDEVDTPRNIPARVRFGRYRGLKSFRTSPWDPYENLPVDYSRIFQFDNFRKTRDRILKEDIEGVAVGERVTIYIKNVPADAHFKRDLTQPFIIYSLLPHEHKMTVASFTAQRTDPLSKSAPIIKSKEDVLIQFGFRKYVIKPIYSSDNRGSANNVSKFERYFHQGRQVIGTYYGPIVMDHEPVLMFKLTPDRKIDEEIGLLATGKMMAPAPTRIVAKRILLTGHPFKINKRSAVIRFMFFNPVDVNYFKPIQLSSKLGRVGHIKESLGTHGYMKCIFDEQLKAQDTVCLSLYKRVFPKWGTTLWSPDSNGMQIAEQDDVIMA